MEVTKVDGRLVRAQNLRWDTFKAVKSAVELFNNSLYSPKNHCYRDCQTCSVSTATAYNHFPENKLDIYGSLFQEGFKDVVTDFEIFMKSDPKSEEEKTFLNVIAMKCVGLGMPFVLRGFK